MSWAVPADADRQVKVDRDGDQITVTWFCGGTRTFLPDDLRSAIANVEALRIAPEAWVNDTDSAGRGFFAHVGEDGELHADEVIREATSHVPWDELRAALDEALQAESEDSKRRSKSRARKGS